MTTRAADGGRPPRSARRPAGGRRRGAAVPAGRPRSCRASAARCSRRRRRPRAHGRSSGVAAGRGQAAGGGHGPARRVDPQDVVELADPVAAAEQVHEAAERDRRGVVLGHREASAPPAPSVPGRSRRPASRRRWPSGRRRAPPGRRPPPRRRPRPVPGSTPPRCSTRWSGRGRTRRCGPEAGLDARPEPLVERRSRVPRRARHARQVERGRDQRGQHHGACGAAGAAAAGAVEREREIGDWPSATASTPAPDARLTAAVECCSGSGAFLDGSAAEARALEGRGQVGLIERADVGARRDDLVDPVEDLVGEGDVEAGEQVVEAAPSCVPRAVRWSPRDA